MAWTEEKLVKVEREETVIYPSSGSNAPTTGNQAPPPSVRSAPGDKGSSRGNESTAFDVTRVKFSPARKSLLTNLMA